MEKRKVLAIMMLFLLAFSLIGSIGLPVYAATSGDMEITRPDLVAPGGALDVDASALIIGGGKAYFYISKDEDSEIASGDIQFTSLDEEDLDESITLFVPSNLAVWDEYFLKVTDVRGVGKECVVATGTFEVPEEVPTVTIDPVDGVVGDEPTIEGEGAEDFDEFEFYWNYYNDPSYGPAELDDGEFTVEEDDEWEPILDSFPIPNGYEGVNNLIVYFRELGGDELSLVVEFTLEPDIAVTPVETWSIEAGAAESQFFTISGTGFPKGDVDEDTTRITVKDFTTGSTLETYETVHGDTSVVEDEGSEGTLEIDVEVEDTVEFGEVTVIIEVDSSTRTFENEFLASEPTDVDDFTSLKYVKANKKEGKIGDNVKFSLINLPSDATVVITMVGETVTITVPLDPDTADGNGAFKETYKLTDLPGGDYDVRASVTADAVTREKKFTTFTILPTFRILDDSGRKIDDSKVGNEIKLEGKGFLPDASINSVIFGTKEVDFEPNAETGDTGYFLVEEDDGDPLEVPHVSGGGLAVTVKVLGEDAEGDDLEATVSLTIKPKLLAEGDEDWEVGILDPEDGSWVAFGDVELFPGSPVRLVGWGFLGGETVTVKLYDADDDLLGTATITDGENAASNGNLELVLLMPDVKAIYPGGEEDVYLKAAGSTSSNNAKLSDLAIDPVSDDNAKLYFGMDSDGDIDLTKKVGDTVRVIGAGFRTKSLTLTIPDIDEDVGSATATYGAFDTSIVLPEMEGSGVANDGDGLDYELVEDETDIEVVFYLQPKLILTPPNGYSGATITVQGTGFEDGTDVDINWLGTAEEENLDTVDGDDVDDGSFSIEVETPTSVAQAYRVKGVVDDEEWADATFTILSLFESQLNKTLSDILEELEGLDVTSINTAISGLKTDVNALKSDLATTKADAAAAKTAATAAQTAATGATTAATDAKTAATAAQTAATGATTAANNAKTAADNAKLAVDGLTGLVYAAVGASIVSALAAVVAVIQLRTKVVG